MKTRDIVRANWRVFLAAVAGTLGVAAALSWWGPPRSYLGAAAMLFVGGSVAGTGLVWAAATEGIRHPRLSAHALFPGIFAAGAILAVRAGLRAHLMPAALWNGVVVLLALAAGARWMVAQHRAAGTAWAETRAALPATAAATGVFAFPFVVLLTAVDQGRFPYLDGLFNVLASGAFGCALGLTPMSPWLALAARRRGSARTKEDDRAAGPPGGRPVTGHR